MGKENIEFNDRGFAAFEEFDTTYGAKLRVYESSAALGPHIWLKAQQPEPKHSGQLDAFDASVHMNLKQAEQLRDNLTYLIDHAKEAWDKSAWYDEEEE